MGIICVLFKLHRVNLIVRAPLIHFFVQFLLHIHQFCNFHAALWLYRWKILFFLLFMSQAITEKPDKIIFYVNTPTQTISHMMWERRFSCLTFICLVIFSIYFSRIATSIELSVYYIKNWNASCLYEKFNYNFDENVAYFYNRCILTYTLCYW